MRFSWLPFLDLNQRPPWLDATHQILLARLTTVICFANRKSLQSVQPSVACLLLDENIWFDLRKEIKTKNRGICLGFFVLAPLFGLEPKTPWLRLRLPRQRVGKFDLCVLQHTFFCENRQSFRQNHSASDWMLMLRGLCSSIRRKKPRKKHRFCGAFFLAPLLGLEPKTPWLTVRCSNQLS